MSETAAAVNSGHNSGHFQRHNVYAFPPGQSGNPKGRPKRTPLSEALEKDLDRRIPRSPDMAKLCANLHLSQSSTWAQLIARSMVLRAIRETAAMVEVADRVEGKAVARVEHDVPNSMPIRITVTYEDQPARE